MNLNCLERIVALQLLANYQEGSFLTFKTLGTLRGRLGFTEEEIKKFELKEEGGQYTWNQDGNECVDFDFTDIEKNLISEQLEKLDSEKKLRHIHISLYEKFIENK